MRTAIGVGEGPRRRPEAEHARVGSPDAQDRLLTYGPYAYTYGANGELESKVDTASGDTWLYQYDVRGNLLRVDLPGGDVIEYLIDGKDRRVGKLVNGSLVNQWLWTDQLRIAAELDGAGNLVSRFVYGSKPTTPEFVLTSGNTYRVIADHLGSVRALVNVNDASDVPVALDYDVFGEVSGEGVGFVPQGFAGGMYDVDTGLVRFGARDYDPVVGRWVAKDPIGWEGDGVNLYAYVMGDPINYVDPAGMISKARHCKRNLANRCPKKEPLPQCGTGNEQNFEKKAGKYRSPDGSECAYDQNGNLLPDDGSYSFNFAPDPYTLRHIWDDVVPDLIWGKCYAGQTTTY